MVVIVLVVKSMFFRTHMFTLNMGNTPTTLSEEDYRELGRRTEGYSGSDISIVVRDALMQVSTTPSLLWVQPFNIYSFSQSGRFRLPHTSGRLRDQAGMILTPWCMTYWNHVLQEQEVSSKNISPAFLQSNKIILFVPIYYYYS